MSSAHNADDTLDRAPDGQVGKEESGARGASARNANPVYELFVLGELLMGPQYGYKLQTIMQRILGPFHRLSWGTLYPLIRRLEQQGLIRSENQPRSADQTIERGQPRKVYYLTDAGQTRFFTLMLDPGEYTSDYSDLFTMKLSKFSLLTAEQQLMVLQQYREYLSILRDHYDTNRQKVLANPSIGKEELPYILQIAERYVRKFDAELAWLEGRIADLSHQEKE